MTPLQKAGSGSDAPVPILPCILNSSAVTVDEEEGASHYDKLFMRIVSSAPMNPTPKCSVEITSSLRLGYL